MIQNEVNLSAIHLKMLHFDDINSLFLLLQNQLLIISKCFRPYSNMMFYYFCMSIDPASVSQQQPYKSAVTKVQPKPPQTW